MGGEPLMNMNRIGRTIGLAVLAAGFLSSPRLPAAEAPNSLQSLRLIESDLPPFPHDLVQIGVREGEVRLAFSVDANGRVEDCLAVYYTHPDFARVCLNALRRWKFEPARFRGQPIAAASEVTVTFEVEGTVVVSLTPSETIAARIHSLVSDHDVYRPCTLKELDRIPTPLAAPAPSFPAQLLGTAGVRHVTVAFYIDEEGKVRLPSVSETADADLAAYAIDAMRNWKFEPPTRRGRPVLVRATQQFNFRAQPKPAASTE